MSNKRDYLKECHAQVVGQVKEPLTFDMFLGSYCTRCLQPECTRSIHGSTKFDQRVSSWHDRLFLNVPRMDQSDPRFESISNQNFVPAQETLVVRGWDSESSPEPPKVIEPMPEMSVVEEQPVDTNPPVHFQPVSSSNPILRDTLLMNTPVRGDQYLPGAPTPPVPSERSTKNIDSWGAPEQSTPSEVVVRAGATVHFGSGSGVSK